MTNQHNLCSNSIPAWVRCPHCGDFWCRIHEAHAHECACPPLEDWEVDPYTEGGPIHENAFDSPEK